MIFFSKLNGEIPIFGGLFYASLRIQLFRKILNCLSFLLVRIEFSIKCNIF